MLPVVEEKTICATFERAQARHGMNEYTHSMLNKIHEENRPLLESLCVILDGFKLDEKATGRALTMMGLMYDCLNTQGETDELHEMFGEGENDDA